MILSIQIIENQSIINVRTTSNYAGGLAITGLHEEVINNFHVFLFRNLNILDSSERQVKIEQMK